MKKLMTKKKIIIISVILALILTGIGTTAYVHYRTPDPSPVISDAKEDINDTSKGMIRVKINTVMHYKKGRIADLNFRSINKNRYMKCKIRLDGTGKDDYIVETPFLPPGKVVKSIAVKRSLIEKGTTRGTAEIYTYLSENENSQIGQTDVEISIERE